MERKIIILDPTGNTFTGRDRMDKNEVKLGDVTYQLSRVFIGSRTATELLIDHVVEQAREDVAVDVQEIPAV